MEGAYNNAERLIVYFLEVFFILYFAFCVAIAVPGFLCDVGDLQLFLYKHFQTGVCDLPHHMDTPLL